MQVSAFGLLASSAGPDRVDVVRQPTALVIVVADGAGGPGEGALAAETLVAAVLPDDVGLVVAEAT